MSIDDIRWDSIGHRYFKSETISGDTRRRPSNAVNNAINHSSYSDVNTAAPSAMHLL